ncbi:Uncharacterised protein [Morganella morganii]|nr:Uncharacterised protein [Morganella morganii]
MFQYCPEKNHQVKLYVSRFERNTADNMHEMADASYS